MIFTKHRIMSIETIVRVHTHTHTHTEAHMYACTHTRTHAHMSILIIQTLIYTQLKQTTNRDLS